MAGETYYFLFSLILVAGIALYLVNLLYLRAKGKTTFGLAYKPGTPEYKRVIRIARNRNIVIASLLAMIFIANLIYDVNRLMGLDDREYARTMLTYGPVVVILFFIGMILIGRNQVKNFQSNKHD